MKIRKYFRKYFQKCFWKYFWEYAHFGRDRSATDCRFSVTFGGKVRNALNGYPWISMDIQGHPWISMDMHGYPWTSMDTHGYPWISMEGSSLVEQWFPEARPPRMDKTLVEQLFLEARTLIKWPESTAERSRPFMGT